uniref:Protein kinase putative n=1 Tax=Albugo laibachii Nc14 TaxID=890382 RepID=F0WTG9_9STRA|nr:protein kinase putative [Albugo laibachii Nc14]|eukprot:CCA24659.1 protein kinase putative [Albugo laibachii Nc14]
MSDRVSVFLKSFLWSGHPRSQVESEQMHPNPVDSRRETSSMVLYLKCIAPELVAARSWVNKCHCDADIYSLGMFMWDILHPSVREMKDDLVLHFQETMKGHRPQINSTVHPRLMQLIQMCWNANARQRPSASQVVVELESIQREISSRIAMILMDSMTLPKGDEKDNESVAEVVCGKRIINRHNAKFNRRNGKESGFAANVSIRKMMEFDFVHSTEEAVRLGNAFMTCGFLHHRHHMLAFEYSMESFYFDKRRLQDFCRLLCTARSEKHSERVSIRGSWTTSTENINFPNEHNYKMQNTEFCKCQELGIYGADTLTETSRRVKHVPNAERFTVSSSVDIVREDFGHDGADCVHRDGIDIPILHDTYSSAQTPTGKVSHGLKGVMLCSTSY